MDQQWDGGDNGDAAGEGHGSVISCCIISWYSVRGSGADLSRIRKGLRTLTVFC